MAYIHRRPSWYLPDREAAPEHLYASRRMFLKSLGLGGMALAAYGCGPAELVQPPTAAAAAADAAPPKPLPAFERNPEFADGGRAVSDEKLVTTFNNFYEFGFSKTAPAINAKGFSLDPYTLEIGGLVEKPIKLDLDDIEQMGYEERVYRFRCVEAWSMVVPWAGVPLSRVLEKANVKPEAKFVAFETFYDPERAPGQRRTEYTWPYHEGLRLDEAMNDLAFVATGIYGKRLPPQNGTPLRIITPWKYGYKGAKSVVKMTLVSEQPPTLWNDAIPSEYKFYSNVDPEVPHPRWSQAKEALIGSNVKDTPTQWYNGYGEQVGHLYADRPRELY